MDENESEPNTTSRTSPLGVSDGHRSRAVESDGSSTAVKPPQNRKIPSTYPPSFSASAEESYAQWKRSVHCWIAGEGGQLPEDVMGPRCLSVLKGRASVIVRHLKIEDASKPGGLSLVFRALESSPLVSGEAMESFIMRVQAQRSVMEEEDPTFAVGDRFLVGYILDHAELTVKDRAMVLAAAQNQMTSDAVFPALRRMGPFLQGTVPIGKGGVDAPLLPELHDAASKTSPSTGEGRKPWSYKAHVVEEIGAYQPSDEEEIGDPELLCEELEAATHAALAAYSSSQAKLKALKQARGYFKRSEPHAQPDRKERLKKLMQENPCRACGGYGHWSKDPECPKNAKGTSVLSATTASMTSGPSTSSPSLVADTPEHAAMSAILEQMLKEQRHQSSREYMAAVCSGDWGKPEEFVTLFNDSAPLLTACMVVDLGCLRSVAGFQWIMQEVKRCKQQGRFVEVQKTLDYFRFGDGARRP